MMMRLVWPDEATMPKKRKAIEKEVPDDVAEAETVEATEVAEPQDGPVEAAATAVEEQPDAAEVEAAADEAGGDEAGESAPIDPRVLEAILFSTHHPLTGQRIGELLGVTGQKAIRAAVQDLNKQYEDSGRTFRVEQVAGGYQLLSLPEYGDILKRLLAKESDAKLTKAALETLAIVAYKQPILRADVEAIRGVACGETIRSLMEKHLVNIAGRAEEPGRPILYGTTKRFLQLFGLNNLKDLPQGEELPKPKAEA
jgi:segregation and condensation protein B